LPDFFIFAAYWTFCFFVDIIKVENYKKGASGNEKN
jgi:hypothetical protein